MGLWPVPPQFTDIGKQFGDARIKLLATLGIHLRLHRILYARVDLWEESFRLLKASLSRDPRVCQASEGVIQFLFLFGQRFNRGKRTAHGFLHPGYARTRGLGHGVYGTIVAMMEKAPFRAVGSTASKVEAAQDKAGFRSACRAAMRRWRSPGFRLARRSGGNARLFGGNALLSASATRRAYLCARWSPGIVAPSPRSGAPSPGSFAAWRSAPPSKERGRHPASFPFRSALQWR